MIITPIDLESIALTTWPQHMFMPFYTKDILYKIYHNHKITFNILSILYLKNNLLVYPPFIAKEIIYILLLILSFFYSYDYNYNQNVFIKYFIPSLFVMIPYFHPNLHVLSVKALMTRAWPISHYIIILKTKNVVKCNLIQKINTGFIPQITIYPSLKLSLGDSPQHINNWNYPFFALTNGVLFF